MRSTGEVMENYDAFGLAYAKAGLAAGIKPRPREARW